MLVVDKFIEALSFAGWILWETWWALVLGFTLAGAVNVFVSEEWLTRVLGDNGWRELGLGTLFGSSMSSCSFTAVATAKNLFKKGASPVASLAAFQMASTNLAIGLGLVMLVLLGWQFVVANVLGGLIAIGLLAAIYKYGIPDGWFTATREYIRSHEEPRDPICRSRVDPSSDDVRVAETNGKTQYFCSESCEKEYGEQASNLSWLGQILSIDTWKDVFRHAIDEWSLVWKSILVGFLIAGFFAAFIPVSWWVALFTVGTEGTLTGVVIASIIAVLIGIVSFVGSMGNVAFVLVLWTNGLTFGGVLSFILADLIVPPIVYSYRRYYGVRMAAVLFGATFLVAVAVGVFVQLIWSSIGLIPPRSEAGGTVSGRYTLLLNLVFTAVFAIEVYVAFGPERILTAVRAAPQKLAGAIRRCRKSVRAIVGRLKRMMQKLREAFGLMKKSFGTMREAFGLMKKSMRKMGKAFKMMKESFQIMKSSSKKMKRSVWQFKQSVRMIKTAFKEVLDR
jgi:uncharacterized membrane protein YraQ (UPF0718 family)